MHAHRMTFLQSAQPGDGARYGRAGLRRGRSAAIGVCLAKVFRRKRMYRFFFGGFAILICSEEVLIQLGVPWKAACFFGLPGAGFWLNRHIRVRDICLCTGRQMIQIVTPGIRPTQFVREGL